MDGVGLCAVGGEECLAILIIDGPAVPAAQASRDSPLPEQAWHFRARLTSERGSTVGLVPSSPVRVEHAYLWPAGISCWTRWGGAPLTGSPWAPGPHGSPSGRQEEGALPELLDMHRWPGSGLPPSSPDTTRSAVCKQATPGGRLGPLPAEAPHAPLLPSWQGCFLRARKEPGRGA